MVRVADKDLDSVVPEALVDLEGLVAQAVLEELDLRGDEVVDLVVKVVMRRSVHDDLMGLSFA